MPPNQKQTEAITGTGIQLVLAGPGSGKTRVITEKVLHLLSEGAQPSEILALTFSEKAAREMEDRLCQVTDIAGLTVRTFHSFCLDVLEDNVLDSGLNFSAGLISRSNQLVWGLRNIDAFGFEQIEVGNNAAGVITSITDGISAFRDELISSDDLAAYLRQRLSEESDPDTLISLRQLADLQKVYAAYEQYKRREMLLDYDDMIAEAVRLFQAMPHVLKRYREQYRYLLVDEFQDTNYAQFVLVKLLCGGQLCVVGDDDQTIYRFRGAYFGNFRDFRETYVNHIETLLDRNYRNSGRILRLALRLMESAQNRHHKPLITGNPDGEPVIVAECESEQAEAQYVLSEIQRLKETTLFSRKEEVERQFRYRDIAILCRRRAEGKKFHRILHEQGIPCEFAGELDLFSVSAIRDAIAYLKAIDNPITAGIALNRILRGAGVPETVVQRINISARERSRNDPAADGVYEAMHAAAEIGGSYAFQVEEIARRIEALIRRKVEFTLPELVYEVIIRSTGIYRRALADETGQSRLALNQLLAVARDYGASSREASIADFLEYLELLSGFFIEVEDQEERDAVRVMTIHKSKGREFPVVFLVDMSHRKFPLDYRRKTFTVPGDLARGKKTGDDEKALHIQEERRLCYVAMTRAEERLYLTRAKRYDGNKNESGPSQFLTEMDYQNNPDVRVVPVRAKGTGLRVEAANPLEERKHAVQDQIYSAVAELRTRTALARLIELEKIRQIEAGLDPEAFDRQSFFSVPENGDELRLILHGRRLPLITGNHTFSASGLETYRTCPLKYKFQHVLLVPSLPKSFFSLGSAVHSVIEHLSRDQIAGTTPSREQAIRYLDRYWTPAGFSSRTEEREKRSQAEGLLDTYLSWQEKNPNRILEVESGFRISFDGRAMKGFIDRLEQTPDGGCVVIDFKTGSKPGDLSKNTIPSNIQLNLYSLAVLERYGVLPERSTLYYIKDDRQVDYRPTEASIQAFREMLAGMVGRICEEVFPAMPGYGCRWCDYRSLCEEREAGEQR